MVSRGTWQYWTSWIPDIGKQANLVPHCPGVVAHQSVSNQQLGKFHVGRCWVIISTRGGHLYWHMNVHYESWLHQQDIIFNQNELLKRQNNCSAKLSFEIYIKLLTKINFDYKWHLFSCFFCLCIYIKFRTMQLDTVDFHKNFTIFIT